LAYHRIAWLEVTYAEYQARCACCHYFRTWPLDVPPKADYDATVRQAVLDRLLHDRLNIEQTKAAMQHDFLVKLSEGFVYDCLRWQLARLNLAAHHRMVRQRFSGTLCVDELHLGVYTLLLATDPLADLPVGFALVRANDREHMRRFLRNLARWGLRPEVVVSDGSNLYPELVAQIWPQARHQLCVFHLLRELLDKVLAAVRRLRRAQASRGRAGRKRQAGRPRKEQKARRQRQGPTAKDKAVFVWKNRFLIVKRTAKLTKGDWNNLVQMFQYLPELRPLWYFSRELHRLLDDSKSLRVARWRYTLLCHDSNYQGVRELVEALDLLSGTKLVKAMAFVEQPAESQVRTNNHVERLNRRLRFAEKVRYRWRKRKWVVCWVVLLLDVCWQQAAESLAVDTGETRPEKRLPRKPRGKGSKKAA
jgi:hypothetical protein